MSILFRTNDKHDFPNKAGISAVEGFDPDYVPYGIDIGAGVNVDNTLDFSGGVQASTWVHFCIYTTDTSFSSNATVLWFHAGTTNLGRLVTTSAETLSAEAGNTGAGVQFALPPGVLKTVDLNIRQTGGHCYVDVYADGSFIGTSDDTSHTPATPDSFRFVHCIGFSSPTYISEVIIADESTIGMRLAMFEPATAGNHDQWAGARADLTDGDPLTGMNAGTAGNLVSHALSAYAGDMGLTPVDVSVVQQLRRGATGPQDARNLLRIAGTDYNGPSLGPTEVMQRLTTVWTQNPATAAAWAVGDLAALEAGLEALA